MILLGRSLFRATNPPLGMCDHLRGGWTSLWGAAAVEEVAAAFRPIS